MTSWNGSCPCAKRKYGQEEEERRAIKKKIAQVNESYTPQVIINVVFMSQTEQVLAVLARAKTKPPLVHSTPRLLSHFQITRLVAVAETHITNRCRKSA